MSAGDAEFLGDWAACRDDSVVRQMTFARWENDRISEPACDACGKPCPENGHADLFTYEVGNGRAVWHWRLCGNPNCMAIAAANTFLSLKVALDGSSLLAPRL
jgi:hypothetical protein